MKSNNAAEMQCGRMRGEDGHLIRDGWMRDDRQISRDQFNDHDLQIGDPGFTTLGGSIPVLLFVRFRLRHALDQDSAFMGSWRYEDRIDGEITFGGAF